MIKTFILLFWFMSYPVHESFMGIEYDREKELYNVFLKMNYENFVLDYRNSVNDDQDFSSSGKIDTAVILVREYLNKKVHITGDGKRLKPVLQKIQYDDGSLSFDIVYRCNRKIKELAIKNLILSEVFEDQTNFLLYRHGKTERGVKLTRKNPDIIFRLKN
jgi:hypothetical protein